MLPNGDLVLLNANKDEEYTCSVKNLFNGEISASKGLKVHVQGTAFKSRLKVFTRWGTSKVLLLLYSGLKFEEIFGPNSLHLIRCLNGIIFSGRKWAVKVLVC